MRDFHFRAFAALVILVLLRRLARNPYWLGRGCGSDYGRTAGRPREPRCRESPRGEDWEPVARPVTPAH